MSETAYIRCKNDHFYFLTPEKARAKGIPLQGDKTEKRNANGNILCFIEGKSIYLKCSHSSCKRWSKITFDLPGISMNFASAGISIKLMPRNFHLNAEKIPCIIEAT